MAEWPGRVVLIWIFEHGRPQYSHHRGQAVEKRCLRLYMAPCRGGSGGRGCHHPTTTPAPAPSPVLLRALFTLPAGLQKHSEGPPAAAAAHSFICRAAPAGAAAKGG